MQTIIFRGIYALLVLITILLTLVEPNLTTVNYPGQEMGEIVANAIVNHLEGKAPMTVTSTIILKSELLIRESSLKISKKEN